MIDPTWAVEGSEPDDGYPARPSASLVSLHYLRNALRRTWPGWVAAACLGLLLGVGWTYAVPAKSAGTVTVLLAHDPATDPVQSMATDVTMLRTRAVATGVIDELGLELTPEEFHGTVTVVPETTRVLILTVTGPDERAAVARADALSRQYLEFRNEQIRLHSSALVEGYRQRVASLTARVDDLTTQYEAVDSSDPLEQNEATELLTQRSQLTAEINNVQQAIQDSSVKMNSLIAASKVLDAPSPVPHSPTRRLVLTAASGLIGGLALGMGLVVFRALTSDRLRRREEVAVALGAPVRLSVHGLRPRPPRRRVRRSGASTTRALEILTDGLLDEIGARGGRPARLALAAVDNLPAGELVVAAAAARLALRGTSVFVVDLTGSRGFERAVGRAMEAAPGERPGGTSAPVVYRPDGVPSIAHGLVGVPGPATGRPPQHDPRRASWDRADVVLTLTGVDPAVGVHHLKPWADEVVVLVTAGRSSAERLRTTAGLVRSAGLDLRFAVLVGSDRTDESLGTPEAVDTTWPHARRTS